MAKDYAMMFDATTCIGCEACTVACKERYEIPRGYFRTRMSHIESGTYPTARTTYFKSACQHCSDAACIQACPAGAISRVDGVAVVTDRAKCIGCGYCVTACPFGAAQFDRAAGKSDKCSFCFTIVPEQPPFCASVCPVSALTFGPRSEIMAKAQARVAQLSGQGINGARLYGQDELGGLGVVTVMAGDPSAYGVPVDPNVPWGVKLWRYVFRPVGGVAALATIAALWVNWTSGKSLRPAEPTKEVK